MKNEHDGEKCVFGFCFLHPKTKEYDYAIEIGTRKQFKVISKILELKKVNVFQASCESERELAKRSMDINKRTEELELTLSFATMLINHRRQNAPAPKPPPSNYPCNPLYKQSFSALSLC